MNKQVVLIGVIAVLIAVIKQTHADGWTSATTGCISGYDIRQLSGKTVESCKQRCVDETECLSIDFYIRSGRCFLNSIRKEDVMRDNPGAWKAWNTCELYELTQDSDMDECESDPCQNEATCNDGPDGYNCTCAVGFEGEHCETSISEGSVVVGGWSSVNLTDEDLARLLQDLWFTETDTDWRLISAQSQVVAGMRYNLTLEVSGRECYVVITELVSNESTETEENTCSGRPQEITPIVIKPDAGVLPIRLNCHVCICGTGVDCVPSSFPGVCMSRDCLSLRASFSG